MPEFLTKVKYSNPENTVDAPFQMAFDTNEHSFAWLNQRPELIKKFANHMGGTHAGLSTWMEPKFYPLEQNLVKGAIEGKDFFVDVGGSQGHDLQESCRMCPQLPGRLVLQDQDGVIRNVTGLDPQIFPMAHDFFTPQPVRGRFANSSSRFLAFLIPSQEQEHTSCIESSTTGLIPSVVPS